VTRARSSKPDLLPKAPIRQHAHRALQRLHPEHPGRTDRPRQHEPRRWPLQKGDSIDHRTGLILQAKIGDHLRAGEPLLEIHARSESEAASVRQALLDCYSWSEEPVQAGPL